MNYSALTDVAKKAELSRLQEEYRTFQQRGLTLNMSRGVPCPEQLDLSVGLLAPLEPHEFKSSDGTDIRNYGNLAGTPEARRFMASLIGVEPENVIVAGSASLNIMFDLVMHAYLHGVYGGAKPWCQADYPKFLCPVPGYDRHFRITEYFGIEMINVPMLPTGPDMDIVEEYVRDPSVKGIWCVPKYSNPQGYTYSDETVRRFARLRPAADDFRIFWDNAYLFHDLYPDDPDRLLSIFDECRKAGTEDMVYEFISTSKITFSGAGVASLAASVHNVDYVLKQFGIQTIGWNKVNMQMHVKFFGSKEGLTNHMRKHAALLVPKFDTVIRVLKEKASDVARWTTPRGGYFISLDTVMHGCAKRVVELCAGAGVTMTNAGAPFPYAMDPNDTNIRIAPTCVSLENLETATELMSLCIRIATLEKLLQ